MPQVLLYPYCPHWSLSHLTPMAGYPPSLWLSGSEDQIATLPETKACYDKIAAAGNPNAVNVTVLRAQHAFDRNPRDIAYSSSAIEASKTAIEAFLKTYGLAR